MQIDQNYIRRQLRKDLAALTDKNPRYSLRAYASKLGLSPSFLSRFLNAQKNISLQQALRLSKELNISISGDLPSGAKSEAQILQDSIFKLISDWYHFPILELIQSKNFKSSPKWIAQRMGLSTAIVDAALDRMEEVGLIEINKGKIRRIEEVHLRTSNDITSIAQRKHHQQMLIKASEALDEQSIDEREYQGMNINFKKSEIKKAKKRIRQFIEGFNQEFANNHGEDVYQLNLQFFNLTGHGPLEEK